MIISHFVTQQDADLSGTLLPITSLSELSILSGPSWGGGPSAPKWNKTSTLLLDGDLWDLASTWDSEGCIIDGWLKQDCGYKQFIVFIYKCEQFSLVLSINIMHREGMNVAWYKLSPLLQSRRDIIITLSASFAFVMYYRCFRAKIEKMYYQLNLDSWQLTMAAVNMPVQHCAAELQQRGKIKWQERNRPRAIVYSERPFDVGGHFLSRLLNEHFVCVVLLCKSLSASKSYFLPLHNNRGL